MSDKATIRWTYEKSDKELIKEIEALNQDSFTLVVACEKSNLPLVYRRCKADPTPEQKSLVRALSGGQDYVRAFSGESFPEGACSSYYYLGWNTMGFGFHKPAVYCQVCGYGLSTIAEAKLVIVNPNTVSSPFLEYLRDKCKQVAIELREVSWLIEKPR